jgi:hypothetical protein
MDDDDRLLEEFARIPPVEMSMEWEARVRARCHSAMTRRRRRRFASRLVDLAAVATLCVYLAAVFAEAARLAAF